MTHPTFDAVSAILSYNPETGHICWKITRGRRIAGNVAGWRDKDGRVEIGFDGHTYHAAQLAWLLFYGEWPSSIVDHADGDPSNDRIANLRLATQRQNLGNSRRPRHNKSGVKGVHWHAQNKKWVAQISVYNKSRHLGSFERIEDAAAAYRSAAIAQFGEFARLD